MSDLNSILIEGTVTMVPSASADVTVAFRLRMERACPGGGLDIVEVPVLAEGTLGGECVKHLPLGRRARVVGHLVSGMRLMAEHVEFKPVVPAGGKP